MGRSVNMTQIKKLQNHVEIHRKRVFAAEKFLWGHPAVGFKEKIAGDFMERQFRELGYNDLIMAGNIPGFYTDIETGRPGPKVLIMSELDALFCDNHPNADPKTGAAHACGHHAQCAAMLGIAGALKEPGALDEICGSIRLMVVPAEEGGDSVFRDELKAKGIIKYFSGKVEFMHRGFMDGVDIAFLVHGLIDKPRRFLIRSGGNGLIAKRITFRGIAAHTGSSSHLGVNALYAANIALNAINALRETFVDDERIRVHPIIVKGGHAVNAIPDEVIVDSFVRGSTIDAIIKTNRKVNRAISGSAATIGATVKIHDYSLSYPMINDQNMMELARDAAAFVVPPEDILSHFGRWTGSCTDMGHVAAVIPSIQVYCSGASGTSHGSDYEVIDVESACINSAKIQVTMLQLLLENNGERAKSVIENKKPAFNTISRLLEWYDDNVADIDGVVYEKQGVALLNY